MSTATQRAREKAERLAARQAEQRKAPAVESTPEPDRPATVSAAAPTKDVRVTVDLAPPLFDAFDTWAQQAQREHTLRGRGIKSEVLRVLVRKLMDDETLREEIIKGLIADRRK